jgi:hypothetical protein
MGLSIRLLYHFPKVLLEAFSSVIQGVRVIPTSKVPGSNSAICSQEINVCLIGI